MVFDAIEAMRPFIQEGELTRELGGTQGQYPHDPLRLPSGPITRLRAKRFKEALNGVIQQVGEMGRTWQPGINPITFPTNLVTMVKLLEDSK